ncbi:hypothetical protein PC116_g30548 [Phytophthora cactorum]|nr:hypothetical protein PC116_g30548 [Phytophthora cactorum]
MHHRKRDNACLRAVAWSAHDLESSTYIGSGGKDPASSTYKKIMTQSLYFAICCADCCRDDPSSGVRACVATNNAVYPDGIVLDLLRLSCPIFLQTSICIRRALPCTVVDLLQS